MRILITTAFLLVFTAVWLISCSKKTEQPSGPYKLSYGDSILYLKNQAGDYVVYPTEQRAGEYTGFPDGIEIDEITGAINVSKSETGLRYRVTHTAPNGTTTSTIVLLSGITFTDKFYYLSQLDSIAFPVYNGNPANPLPLAGSSFDENNTANNGGCSVQTINGQINLAQSVRNGIFGGVPQNDERKDFDIEYRLNDKSGKAKNEIRVRLYWYNTIADVPADLWETLNDRETQGVFLRTGPGLPPVSAGRDAFTAKAAKPRPPCIIIIGQ